MALSDLKKVTASRVLGIDCSTRSLAYALFDGAKPVHCGEVFFEGADLFQRLSDAHSKIPPMVAAGLLKADFVGFEGAWIGPSPQTGLSLAYVYGACISALMADGTKVVTISPMSWQAYVGNPNLKKAEKDALREMSPGKSESWYKSNQREYRKQRTLAFSRQYFEVESGSDNVGDAIAIAHYTANHLTTR